MNLELLLITSFASIITISSSVILFIKIRYYGAQHLNYVALGIFFYAILPITFFPQAFFEGEKYHNLMTYMAIIGAIFTLVGLLLITWNLRIHQFNQIPHRFFILLIIVGNVMSQIITGTKVHWVDNQWEIERPYLIRILLFGGLSWVIFEILILFIRGSRLNNNIWSKIALSFPIGIITSFLLLAFREQLPFSIAFYQIPSSIGSAIFIFVLLKYPQTLVIPGTKLTSLSVVKRDSGISLLTFPDNPDFEISNAMQSAAITGITNLIREIAGKEHLPSNLGYADYLIGIFPDEKIFLYSISDGAHPVLDGLLKIMVKKWALKLKNFDGKITKSLKKEFHEYILQNFSIFI